MNLPAIAAAAARTAFGLASSVTTSWRFQYGTPTRTHNATTDTTAVTWQHDDQNVPGLPYKPSDKRETPDAANNAQKMLAIQAAKLSAPAALDETGIATDADGTTWQIADVTRDPANALVILSLKL